MTNKQAKLMKIKSISRWIDSADRWIESLRERFSSMGSPLPDNIFTDLSAATQSLYCSGVREWARNENATKIKFPGGLSTTQGALAGIGHVRGLRAGATAQWQSLMDELSEGQVPSSAGDKAYTEAANSQPTAPASRTELFPAKALSDVSGHGG